MNRGILLAIGAYLCWGFLPIYWKALQDVPAGETMAHRMVWSCVFLVVLLTIQGHWSWLKSALGNRRIVLTILASAIMLAVNWFIYIWAINSDNIVETSLGYFINPLISVVLGLIFLAEHLRRGQMVAILLALAGVAYLTFGYGEFPWIALSLAFTFGFYGLLRKTALVESREGLTMEMAALAAPALIYLLLMRAKGDGAFLDSPPPTSLLLVGTGLVTALPLLLFGMAARRITLTNIGLLQYIAPTIQFLIGVFVYQEAFTQERLIGFVIIWLGLIIYAAEGFHRGRRNVKLAASANAVTGKF